MSALNYLIPDVEMIQSRQLDKIPEACNLKSVLHDACWNATPCNTSPDGRPGCVLHIDKSPGSDGKQSPCSGYQPDHQTWCEVWDGDGKVTHWVGWHNETPPKPQDLIRNKTVTGHNVELRQHEWIIPVVHAGIICPITIPNVFTFGPQGLTMQVSEEYQKLTAQAERVFEELCGIVEHKLSNDDLFYFCSDLLNVNYRIGPKECAALELFDTSAFVSVCVVACGMKDVKDNEESKKN